MNRRCTATTASGKPCRGWAVVGSHPPRCAPHGGGTKPVGAPKNNRNALKHGLFAESIPTGPDAATPAEAPSHLPWRPQLPGGDRGCQEELPSRACRGSSGAPHATALSDDLRDRLVLFGCYLDERASALPLEELARLLDLYSRAIGRLVRIKRTELDLAGGLDAQLQRAVDEALDELAQEWKVPL